MAYIVKRKNREGKYYVYLIESFREGGKVKKRTIKAYGSLDSLEKDEPGAFERLRKEAKLGLLHEDISSQLSVTYNLNQEISYDDMLYGWKVLEELFHALKIPEALKSVFPNTKKVKQYQKVLELLVYQQILNPGSKFYTLNSHKNMFGDWDIDENTLYRSLLPLSQAKNEIQFQVHKIITETMERTGTLVFYDMTNYYFEIDFNDEDIEDEKTREIIKGLRKKGLYKSKSGSPIIQLGLFMDTQGIPISYQLFSGNEIDSIAYIPAIKQIKEQFGLENIVVVTDKEMNSKKNVAKILENKDGRLFSQSHRGKRGALTNIQDSILEPFGWIYNEDMIQHYEELCKMGDCFEITKSNIESKPDHVRMEEHIEAHFLTYFLALIFLRILQSKTNWELSPARLIEALKSSKSNELTTGFYRVQANDDLRRIFEILEIKWDKGIVKYEELNKFCKGWYTT